MEIENFFATYKTLEGKHTVTLGWHGVDVALRTIEQGKEQAASGRQ